MSPSSSSAAIPAHVRARGSSNATPVQDPPILKSPRLSSRPGSPGSLHSTSPSRADKKASYTVFIRLPFPRGDFKDPAPVNWNATKDRQLWKLISKANDGDLNWERMSADFGVELEFLLMQAAWLSERHIERMRRQVTKISSGGGEAAESKPLPASGSITTGPTLRRASPSLVPSSPTIDAPVPASSGLPPISRTPSSATVTQSRLTGGLQPQSQRAPRGSSGSTHRPILTSTSEASQEHYEDALEHEAPSDSGSDDEPVSALARSQLTFRRPPPKMKAPALNTLASDGGEEDGQDEGDDDDSSNGGGYLPFAVASKSSDPAATMRGKQSTQAHQQPSRPSTATSRPPRPPVRTATESSQSSTTSSTAPQPSSAALSMSRHLSTQASSSGTSQPPSRRRASYSSPQQQQAHPLSPRHRAQLASLSPRSRREGSDGTPSMGSSFSDLDAESLNSSALEDALMSNMQRGGGGSTFSMAGTMAERLGGALGRRG